MPIVMAAAVVASGAVAVVGGRWYARKRLERRFALVLEALGREA